MSSIINTDQFINHVKAYLPVLTRTNFLYTKTKQKVSNIADTSSKKLHGIEHRTSPLEEEETPLGGEVFRKQIIEVRWR